MNSDNPHVDSLVRGGYAHPRYAESLSEFGELRQLPRSGGWLLEREIPDSDYRDAIGCYPLFACEDWSRLHLDLAELETSLVSVSLVPEVYGDYDLHTLHQCFDEVIPFKEHFVSDLQQPLEKVVSRHHKRYVRKAFEEVSCEVVTDPIEFLDEWVELHSTLVKKHDITGLRAFSRYAFSKQLQTPGMVVLKATRGTTNLGAQLWLLQEDVAYGHVLAFSEPGYELGAAYALYWYALEYFADKVRYCDFAGVSGLKDDTASGLAWFKQGWSTEMRTAYFCSRILNHSAYNELVVSRGLSDNQFFPAYRTSF